MSYAATFFLGFSVNVCFTSYSNVLRVGWGDWHDVSFAARVITTPMMLESPWMLWIQNRSISFPTASGVQRDVLFPPSSPSGNLPGDIVFPPFLIRSPWLRCLPTLTVVLNWWRYVNSFVKDYCLLWVVCCGVELCNSKAKCACPRTLAIFPFLNTRCCIVCMSVFVRACGCVCARLLLMP